jgi:hypothetical protein
VAITPRGATQVVDNTTTGNVTYSLPSGTTSGDLPILVYFNTVTTNVWSTASGISGWTQLLNASQASQGEIAAAYRNTTVSAAEITATNLVASVPGDFHDRASALITIPAGSWDTGTVVDVTAVTRSATSDFTNPEVIEMPAIGPTTVDNSLVIIFATARASSPTWSAKPGTATELLAGTSAVGPSNLWIGYAVVTPTGTFAQTSVSVNSSQFELSASFAIRAAASGIDVPTLRPPSSLNVYRM